MATWIDYESKSQEGHWALVGRYWLFALLGALVAITLALGMAQKRTSYPRVSVCGFEASLWYEPYWDVRGPPLYGGWVIMLGENVAGGRFQQERPWQMRCGIGPVGLLIFRYWNPPLGYSYSLDADLLCLSILILFVIWAAEIYCVRLLRRRGAQLCGDSYLAIALLACGLGTLLPMDGHCTWVGALAWAASTVFGLAAISRDRCKPRVALGLVLVLDAIFIAGAFG